MKTIFTKIKVRIILWSFGFFTFLQLTEAVLSERYQMVISSGDMLDVLCGNTWTCIMEGEKDVAYHLSVIEMADLLHAFVKELAEGYESRILIHKVSLSGYEKSLDLA